MKFVVNIKGPKHQNTGIAGNHFGDKNVSTFCVPIKLMKKKAGRFVEDY